MVNLNNIFNESVDEINKQLPKENKIQKEDDFEILGSNSNFDSMALINFVLLIEEKLKKNNIDNLNLLDFLIDLLMEQKKSYKISDLKKDIQNKI